MSWPSWRARPSTRFVRLYHRLALRAEPTRWANSYRQYGERDLLRLLQVRRLAETGVPLFRIGQVGAGGDGGRDPLGKLDDELTASIERLRRARADIAAILRDA